jgi:hypothetical protein
VLLVRYLAVDRVNLERHFLHLVQVVRAVHLYGCCC